MWVRGGEELKQQRRGGECELQVQARNAARGMSWYEQRVFQWRGRCASWFCSCTVVRLHLLVHAVPVRYADW